MIRSTTFIFILLVAPVSEAVPPVLQCEAPIFDFGSVLDEPVIEHDFSIKNISNHNLTIANVRTSCGCTAAKPEIVDLAPGASTQLHASLNLRGRRGEISKHIYVQPAGDFPALTLTMRGKSQTVVESKPPSLRWDVLAQGKAEPQFVEVFTSIPGETFNIVRTDVTSPYIRARVNPVEPGKRYRIELSALETMPAKTLRASLRVYTDHPKMRELHTPIYGQLVSDIVVNPDVLVLPKKLENGAPLTRRLSLTPGKIKTFDVAEVIPPSAEITTRVVKRPNNIWIIELGNVVPSQELHDKEVIIRVTTPEPRELRATFVVQGAAPE